MLMSPIMTSPHDCESSFFIHVYFRNVRLWRNSWKRVKRLKPETPKSPNQDQISKSSYLSQLSSLSSLLLSSSSSQWSSFWNFWQVGNLRLSFHVLCSHGYQMSVANYTKLVFANHCLPNSYVVIDCKLRECKGTLYLSCFKLNVSVDSCINSSHPSSAAYDRAWTGSIWYR